jgi:transcriptional regulator with XRE-family HTH domain
METNKNLIKNTHHGDAVRRVRRSLGIKQETLAKMMGITQARVSNFEQKKILDDKVIEKFANALKVSPSLLKELSEDPVNSIIKSNVADKVDKYGSFYDRNNQFRDPLDRLIEISYEETALQERLIELQKERNEIINQLLMKQRKVSSP